MALSKDIKLIRFLLFYTVALSSIYFISTCDFIELFHQTKKITTEARWNNRATLIAPKGKKPQIYTFVDTNGPKYDENQINLLVSRWESFGFETHILTIEDAEKNPLYGKWKNKLDKLKICCQARESFLKHVAMATVEDGGFLMANYVFPLKAIFESFVYEYSTIGTLPNRGSFTSFDGTLGSLVSGSKKEFDRVNELMFTEMERNSSETLENIKTKFVKNSKKSSQLMKEPFEELTKVSNLAIIFTEQQFKEDICQHFKNLYGIRFHPADLKKYGEELVDEIYELANAWLNIYDARCLGDNKPLMFTFRESIQYDGDSSGPDEYTKIWSNYWKGAGFKTVVLSLADAKRHPSYQSFMYTLDEDTNAAMSKGRKPNYEFFCFIRWVAVASSGGGFFSDFDTVPQGFKAQPLPNNGKFSANLNGIPNLLSGSSEQWNKIIEQVYDNYGSNKLNIKTWWFDLLALGKLYHEKDCIFHFYLRDLKIN